MVMGKRENLNWVWQTIKKKKVVQIQKLDNILLEDIIQIAVENNYECYSNLSLKGAKTIQLGDIAKYLLSQESYEQICEGLPHYGVTSYLYSRDPGYQSQLEWIYFDDFYHQLFIESDFLSCTKLLIIHTPVISVQSDLAWIHTHYVEMDLAEITNAVLSKTIENGLRILLVCDDTGLAYNLPTYLIRQQEDAFPIFLLPLFGSDIAESSDITECALRRICGSDENIVGQIRAQLGSNPDDKEGVSDWSIMLRKLRVASLIDPIFLDNMPFLHHSFSRPIDKLENELEFLDIQELIRNLNQNRSLTIGNLSKAWGVHLARGIVQHLYGLLGPIKDFELQENDGLTPEFLVLLRNKLISDPKTKAMVTSWLDNHLAVALGWDEDFCFGCLGSTAMQVDPWADLKIVAEKIKKNDVVRKRIAALTLPFDVAFAQWQLVARMLSDNELLDEWGKSLVLGKVPTEKETAEYLFAVEQLTAEEIIAEWISPQNAHNLIYRNHDNKPIIPASSLKGMIKDFGVNLSTEQKKNMSLSEYVAHYIFLLIEDVEDFLSRQFPEGKGPLLLQLEEWIISTHWRHKIAELLSDDITIPGLKKQMKTAGISPPPPGVSKQDLTELLLEDLGVPGYPRFRGPRGNIYAILSTIEDLGHENNEKNSKEIQGTVVQIYQLCETACMESIIAYAESFRPYYERVLEKMQKRVRRLDPTDWKKELVRLDLGFLINLLGSLLKRTREGQPWCEHFSQTTQLVSLNKDTLKVLNELREARPAWVHGGDRALETDNMQAVNSELQKISFLFLKLCREHNFLTLIPPTVQVVGISKDLWGSHLDLIDDQERSMRAYKVDINEDILGRRFYLIAATNPYPLQPKLIKRIPLSEFVKRN